MAESARKLSTSMGMRKVQLVSLTVPGSRYKIINTVSVEDRWPVSWALRPFLVIYIAFICLAAGIPMGWVWVQNTASKKAWRKATRLVPYNAACKEAKAGRNDRALVLLEVAVSAGFANLKHMREDPDLENLRGMPEFQKLVGSGEQIPPKPEPASPKPTAE